MSQSCLPSDWTFTGADVMTYEPTNLKTSITIEEATDWYLHWLCVDLRFNLLGQQSPSLEKTVATLNRVNTFRQEILHRWDTIYDHPTGLRDAIRAMPKWKELQDLMQEARMKAFAQEVKQFKLSIASKLGIDNAETL
jgi:hypothetical protein